MPPPFLFLFLSYLLLHIHGSSAGNVATEYIYPNFTASSLLFFDSNGIFLFSRNGAFQAGIYKPGTQQLRYYLSVLHVPSKTEVWTANRAEPMPDWSSIVTLTASGMTAEYSNGTVLWSTPPLSSPVFALRLLDSGNLVLLDAANGSLWQSFSNASDCLLSGQLLQAGSYLSSSTSNDDLSVGDYRFEITSSDAVLSWLGSLYWQLSNDANSVKDRDAPVAFMKTNDTGLYLLSSTGAVVFQLILPSAPFRIIKLVSNGLLQITSYSMVNSSTVTGDVFVAPEGSCDSPLVCGSLSLCTAKGNSSSCNCPPQFAASHTGGCTPANSSPLTSNSSCTGGEDISVSYLSLGSGITYFANKFSSPTTSGKNNSDCQTLCTSNCSCLGYFFDPSSQSCYIVDQQLGSLINSSSSNTENTLGYIKIEASSPSPVANNSSMNNMVVILLPTIFAFILVFVFIVAAIVWWRKKQRRTKKSKSSVTKDMLRGSSPSRPVSDIDCLFGDNDDEIDEILIPGLPTRFTFDDLEEVTNNFRTKIGSGGFGAVFKGELPDKSLVAVKKIGGVGVQGRKEFMTEIAVIGNIHHVNLVRLRGFCAQGSRRLLVYEYMNRGSLDRSLFRPTGPLLDWQERMDIAIGAARGLAYLHSGCQPKIVHCDVKPENILLADERQVKIADFGLAKFMTPEQSGLFTTMRGTRGYLAPEWLTNTAISDRTDVYSFGMVLLELLRGRKNRTEHVSDGESKWSSMTSGESARGGSDYFPLVALEKHEQRRYAELADPRLEGNAVPSEVERMVKTALCCLHEDPALRPSMTSVVAMLEGTMEVWEPRVECLGFLRLYGRGFLGSDSGGMMEMENEFGVNYIGGLSATTTNGWPSYLSSQQLSGPR